jgi:Icc-related predicted phosphoesterase
MKDAVDFNAWLGELPHRIKIVVLGNHETNADWSNRVAEVVHHATVLKQGEIEVDVGGRKISIYGTDFAWPVTEQDTRAEKGHPQYRCIPTGTHIVVCHGPALGQVDGGDGCPAFLNAMRRVQPRLVVSGHVHHAHGQVQGGGDLAATTFVNAANAKEGRTMGWDPVVISI